MSYRGYKSERDHDEFHWALEGLDRVGVPYWQKVSMQSMLFALNYFHENFPDMVVRDIEHRHIMQSFVDAGVLDKWPPDKE